jgi:ABC-type ATPase with predicted acetyltransferase domain
MEKIYNCCDDINNFDLFASKEKDVYYWICKKCGTSIMIQRDNNV